MGKLISYNKSRIVPCIPSQYLQPMASRGPALLLGYYISSLLSAPCYALRTLPKISMSLYFILFHSFRPDINLLFCFLFHLLFVSTSSYFIHICHNSGVFNPVVIQETSPRCLGFQVLTAPSDVMSCSSLKVIRRFKKTYRFHLQGRRIGQAIYQRKIGGKQILRRSTERRSRVISTYVCIVFRTSWFQVLARRLAGFHEVSK
jgi:hypothetical protein